MTKPESPRKDRASSLPSGRQIAAQVVERVLRDSAYLSRALDSELQRHPDLDAKERGLATELAYGSLRCYAFLLQALGKHTKKNLPERDPLLVSELVVAAYQILLLDRVPASAAVNAAVSQVRRKRGARVAGFANAVLRQLAAGAQRQSRETAVLESVPRWLAQRLEGSFGPAEYRALVGVGRPTISVARLTAARQLPEAFVDAKACRWAPRAYELAAPLERAERARGTWVVQEEGAQLIAWALGALPGETVLDACAGRGNKTSLLWEIMQRRGKLWAADAHPGKLRSLEREFERLGLEPPELAAVDWTLGQAALPQSFQRALVDAPCTGSGTLRKRPEVMLRLKPDDPARMGRLQEAIVRSVATRLLPHGQLLYAVCSVFEEECEAVVERLADILEPTPFESEVILRVTPTRACQFRLLPNAHGTDGYFLANLRNKQVGTPAAH